MLNITFGVYETNVMNESNAKILEKISFPFLVKKTPGFHFCFAS